MSQLRRLRLCFRVWQTLSIITNDRKCAAEFEKFLIVIGAGLILADLSYEAFARLIAMFPDPKQP